MSKEAVRLFKQRELIILSREITCNGRISDIVVSKEDFSWVRKGGEWEGNTRFHLSSSAMPVTIHRYSSC